VVNVFGPERPVSDAVRVMSEQHVGAVLVVDAGRLVGIFSERDLLRRVVARRLPVEQTPLRAVMTPDPVTATPNDERTSAIVKMEAVGCRHLPVLAEGRVVDTISIRDLLFAEIAEREGENEELKRYIQGQ
jgi:CBS domain-containing protein